MRTTLSTLIFLTALALWFGRSHFVVAAEQELPVHSHALPFERFSQPLDNPSDPSQSSPLRTTLVNDLPSVAGSAFSKASQTEPFLGLRWLLLPHSPVDDEVLIEHPFHITGTRRPTGALVLLDAEDRQPRTIPTADTAVNEQDTNFIVALRLKF